MHAADVDVALFFQELPRFTGLRLPLPSQTDVIGRQQCPYAFFSNGERDEVGEPIANLIEFQHAQCSRIHAGSIAQGRMVMKSRPNICRVAQGGHGPLGDDKTPPLLLAVQLRRGDETETVLGERPGGVVERVMLVQVVLQQIGHVARRLDLCLVAEVFQDVGRVLPG